MKYLHNHDNRRGEEYRRSHKITERACQSGMWVSETGCCQMGLPRGVQLRFDHRDEGGHSKQVGTAASSQVLCLSCSWDQSPSTCGVCWNILSPRLSRIKNCGKFLKQVASIAGKHRRQLEKSSWNWKEQHPLQRPECEQPTRRMEGQKLLHKLDTGPPGFPSCTESLTKEKSYRKKLIWQKWDDKREKGQGGAEEIYRATLALLIVNNKSDSGSSPTKVTVRTEKEMKKQDRNKSHLEDECILFPWL